MSGEEIKLYEFKLYPNEHGLSLNLEEYICLHETPCYYFCINKGFLAWVKTYEEAKLRKIKIYKVHKTSSRKAFKTKEAAFKKFIYRKRKHKMHLTYTLKLVERLLDEVDKYHDSYEEFLKANPNNLIKNTGTLVNDFFLFD